MVLAPDEPPDQGWRGHGGSDDADNPDVVDVPDAAEGAICDDQSFGPSASVVIVTT